MKISETMVFVSDMDAAEAFYRSLGLEVLERQSWGWMVCRDPQSGQKVGALLRSSWHEQGADWPVPRVAFESIDLEGDLARMEALGYAVGAIKGGTDTTRCSHFMDRDRNVYFIWQSPAAR